MRIRQIKPEFPFDEELACCCRDTRLLFVISWMLADREGRMEDRPANIRAKTFPYDEDMTASKVSSLLDELASNGFITRYEVGGRRYIQINNFQKHQHCHVNESKSEIPEPQEITQKHGTSTVPLRYKSVAFTSGVLSTENGVMENKPRKVARPSRKTGAPDEFELSDDLKRWTLLKDPNLDITEEIENFLDYHRARGNAFSSWDAAWRTWVKKSIQFNATKQNVKPFTKPQPEPDPGLIAMMENNYAKRGK